MRVSVFGLGYVGCVSAACLAGMGHEVIGVDVNQVKVDLVNAGRAPVVEERIGELIADVVGKGTLRATTDVREAIEGSEVSLVCVGTPSEPNGSLCTTYLERVTEEIGAALAERGGRHTVVFRSTMLPGTCLNLLVPILEKHTGAGVDVGVAVNPEFLREGTSVRDFFDPPKTVIGELDAASGDVVAALYEELPGEVFRVSVPTAEAIKYADNAFHGLKIGFANELGAVYRALGVDSHQVMDVFLADRKLNISPAYLRPGFAFGGSCLPKDLRSLVHAAQRADVSVPILSHVLPSNSDHLQRAVELVERTGKRRAGIFGLSFKPGTDDLRESPLVELAERLFGKGYDLKIYDANVSLSRLLGANREYIETRLPHLAQLLADSVEEVLDHAEVCLVGTRDPEVLAALPHGGTPVIVDLVHLPDADARRAEPGYVGLAW
ncbi:nucleotide sugar dehydrogenase [Streptomyces acidiscabies]|uniref:GDP-mannose 6-dehydrogenase n=1 Tax=Streptomyces acidiscabies TaxID=42234 RepID=A0AAP6EJ69_9ACTN|nr:nucleotide sugar dehydrogenase [Streptomyces acidiscabies]MBP5942814.1 nucleotide sugar dehydrogenase [Streptomyces sp. LBUM 1476]MBZ3918057.1 nucleotide sugar dehydrogenase [Streptomyces acidiscabies]MDX2964699.1 nucleotide sugar dehydrogenase [Streptomyces acidiscabies]MDX3021915.1 nucleotide sugar dehydrogenase [Streptomyces acidiscabies]MDX3789572.1 nucleotide sugar dehydrogenase [Streptomyces acidiscabies]